jgi:phosphatidylserine/phosphatidylglycerophosphate/cardiolipin synthase-like enzyme
MKLNLKVYDNGDHTCLIWFPADGNPIADCRGFAINRTLNSGGTKTVAYLRNFVGFNDGDKPPSPSDAWKWPVQRYLWWDYFVQPGDKVQYEVVPVTGSNAQGTLALDAQAGSDTSPEIAISGQDSQSMAAYFNKGIIATQWVAQELAKEAQKQQANRTAMAAVIAKKNDPLRNALSGLLRVQILDLLKQAKADGGSVFAALYELNDPELIAALTALGAKANLILGNGAFQPPEKDENAKVREQLKTTTKINVFDRIVSSGHFAHNKFLVVCDKDGKAQSVLSGSTNWTMTGLCTQANNGLIINDPAVADAFLQQWERLHRAGNDFPAELIKDNSTQKTFQVDDSSVTVWFTPTDAAQDLQQARRLINQAKEGILFLFFNPGQFQDDPNHWTLLQSVLNRHQAGSNPYYDPNLYIRGVVNQEIPRLTEEPQVKQKAGARPASNELDPAAPVHPVALFTGGNTAPQRLDQDVLVPAAIKDKFANWMPEMLGQSSVMIHSKVVIIDPFGDKPVVMTGSHNLGPKASAKNDDNLVIIEGNSALAQAFAVNIIAIFQEYRWRHYVSQHATDAKAWHGLQDDDQWQTGYLTNDKAELQFWLGEAATAAASPAPPPVSSSPATTPASSKSSSKSKKKISAGKQPAKKPRKKSAKK